MPLFDYMARISVHLKCHNRQLELSRTLDSHVVKVLPPSIQALQIETQPESLLENLKCPFELGGRTLVLNG